MGPKTVDKLESLSLIVGPSFALLSFALEPGGTFIDSADSNDSEAIITALASNRFLAHLTAILVPIGLLVMLYGLSGINRMIQQERKAASWVRFASWGRFGILSMTVGAFGWVLTSGMNHVLARTDIGSAEALGYSIPVHRADLGLTAMSSMAVAIGFIAFTLSLAAFYPPGLKKTATNGIAVISAIALIALIIGYTAPSQLMIVVARACYFPWTIWSITLGVRFLKGIRLPQIGATAI